jgi:hypothetical protein
MSTPEEQKVPARKPRPSTAATNLQNLFAGGVLAGRQEAQSGEVQLPDQMNQVLLQAAQSTQGAVHTIQELPGVGTLLRVPLDHILESYYQTREQIDQIKQEMLIVRGDEGLRTASYLRRLDVLDEQEKGRAAQVRAPIIQAFLEERITTDGVRVAVERLLKAGEETTEVTKGSMIQRIEQREATTKRFEKYCRLVGEGPIFEEERKGLLHIQQTIQALLERS